jgi:WD40 repeat protein
MVTNFNTYKLCEEVASGGGKAVTDITYSPDGKYVVSADGHINLWDAERGDKIKTFILPNITAVSFSDDGEHIIAGTSTGQVLLVNATTGKIQNFFV